MGMASPPCLPPLCQELERLRGELLALRERAGELAAIRDQLAQVGREDCWGSWGRWDWSGIGQLVRGQCVATILQPYSQQACPALISWSNWSSWSLGMHHGVLLPCCPGHAQERRLTESLQHRLAGSQQQLLETRQEAASRWEGEDDGWLQVPAAKACRVGGCTE